VVGWAAGLAGTVVAGAGALVGELVEPDGAGPHASTSSTALTPSAIRNTSRRLLRSGSSSGFIAAYASRSHAAGDDARAEVSFGP
jgi:hypothetical protein